MTDWEVVFEHPSDGIIGLINAADTEKKLVTCTRAIVETLFARKSDEPLRDEYLTAIDTLNEKRQDGTRPEGIIRQSITSLLREIKADRIERAKAHFEMMAAQTTEKDSASQQNRRSDATDPAEESPESAPDTTDGEPSAFSVALGIMIENRIKVLQCGHDKSPIDGKLLPFLISRVFCDHLKGIVVEHMGPAMERITRGIVAQAERHPKDKQIKLILEALEERKQREVAWDKWQIVWALMTQQSELPKKPAAQVKKKGIGGLLDRFPDKKGISGLLDRLPDNKGISDLLDRLPEKKRKKGWKAEITVEMWEKTCKKIEEENARAKRVWAEIIQKSEHYQAPAEEDNALLMNLFARTPEVIRKQIDAIIQIAEQGGISDQDGNTAKVFSNFQQGKNVDASLLSACYQAPDVLVDGRKSMLKEFMRSFPDTMRKERFPLVERYLKSSFTATS